MKVYVVVQTDTPGGYLNSIPLVTEDLEKAKAERARLLSESRYVGAELFRAELDGEVQADHDLDW